MVILHVCFEATKKVTKTIVIIERRPDNTEMIKE